VRNQFLFTPFFLDQFSPELEAIIQKGWEVNQPSLPTLRQQGRMSALHRPVADFVHHVLSQGERPVSIAGDCCAAIGVLGGVQRAGFDPVLLWLDAHGDFNTWETTPSGFLGGMPLAMIVGRGEQSMMKAVGAQPISEAKVILADGRDLDPGEAQALAGSKVIHVKEASALLDHLPIHQEVLVHLDPDILNPQDAPAMSYRASGGPSLEELRGVMDELARKCQIAAISMSTWSPKLDQDGRSQEACLALLDSLLTEHG
jgi:arginase